MVATLASFAAAKRVPCVEKAAPRLRSVRGDRRRSAVSQGLRRSEWAIAGFGKEPEVRTWPFVGAWGVA